MELDKNNIVFVSLKIKSGTTPDNMNSRFSSLTSLETSMLYVQCSKDNLAWFKIRSSRFSLPHDITRRTTSTSTRLSPFVLYGIIFMWCALNSSFSLSHISWQQWMNENVLFAFLRGNLKNPSVFVVMWMNSCSGINVHHWGWYTIVWI
jgi:hypothetical protein